MGLRRCPRRGGRLRIAGVTSTGSKRPDALFVEAEDGLPRYLRRSAGARVWDVEDREYLDFIMGLGSVALGYGHPAVAAAAREAIDRGGIGPLPPAEEEEVAARLGALMPALAQVRFLKTGAEAVAAAIRLARVHTGRDRVLGCGYHGWLDGTASGAGIPEAVSALFGEIPFNDAEASLAAIRAAGPALACVVVEPVVDAAPSAEWLGALRSATRDCGALLVFDEIKTALRVGLGGAAARYGGDPDLIVLGKAIANGFPLAAVGGRAEVMAGVSRTWISSTLATDAVALSAARATLEVAREQNLPTKLDATGRRLHEGLARLATRYPAARARVSGIPEMCYLRYQDEATGGGVARACARRGLLFKRNAYNFVSLAHRDGDVDFALGVLEDSLRAC